MSAVVTGYASLDYTVTLDRAPEPDRTATVLSRASEFPRLGGSPAYVAAAMVAAGARDAAPVTWVGDDAEGQRYRAALENSGCAAMESLFGQGALRSAYSRISPMAAVTASTTRV